jgi:hypothetical protein
MERLLKGKFLKRWFHDGYRGGPTGLIFEFERINERIEN